MQGQQGIGTILILIAVVLASVIAAFLLIQTADQLRTKALNLQKEHERLLMDRVMVKEVSGVVESCGGDQCITYVIMRVMLAPGSDPLDLTKALFSFITNDVAIQGIRYVPPEDLAELYGKYHGSYSSELNKLSRLVEEGNVSPYPACRATLMNVMRELGIYDISELVKVLDPFRDVNSPDTGTIFTVLWTDCADKGDTRSLLRDQEIMMIYRPKKPLFPSEEFSVEIGSPQGYSVPKDLVTPRGFEKKLIKIFP